MKKGQGGEMIGLLVIVILIIVIIGIYISYGSSSIESGISGDVASLESDKLFNAMLSTTICQQNDFKDVIEACADERQVCGQDGCGLLEESAEEILDALLYAELEERKDAYFCIEGISGEKLFEKGVEGLKEQCLNAGKQFLSEPKKVHPGIAVMALERCV